MTGPHWPAYQTVRGQIERHHGSYTASAGFIEVNFHSRTRQLWYSQASVDSFNDELGDLAHVGGVPWEEYDWEDGTEAPYRAPVRTIAPHTDRLEETLPDTEELWSAELERQAAATRKDDPHLEPKRAAKALRQQFRELREQEQRDRQAAKEAAEEDIRRYRKIKYAMKAKRRAMQNAEWAARRASS